MWTDVLTAVALLLILEGILPFLNPAGIRRAMRMLSEMNDGTLRFVGLTCMVLGVVLLSVVR